LHEEDRRRTPEARRPVDAAKLLWHRTQDGRYTSSAMEAEMKDIDKDILELHQQEVHRARRDGYVSPPSAPRSIHYTDLPPGNPESPLCAEWETYRREVGRLLTEGKQNQFVLIKDQELVGLYATEEEALAGGYRLFPGQAFLVHQVREREPLLRCAVVRPCRS
jgi:hypothetical protein